MNVFATTHHLNFWPSLPKSYHLAGLVPDNYWWNLWFSFSTSLYSFKRCFQRISTIFPPFSKIFPNKSTIFPRFSQISEDFPRFFQVRTAPAALICWTPRRARCDPLTPRRTAPSSAMRWRRWCCDATRTQWWYHSTYWCLKGNGTIIIITIIINMCIYIYTY